MQYKYIFHGNVKTNLLPTPHSLSTSILSLFFSTNSLQSDKPKPVLNLPLDFEMELINIILIMVILQMNSFLLLSLKVF